MYMHADFGCNAVYIHRDCGGNPLYINININININIQSVDAPLCMCIETVEATLSMYVIHNAASISV